MAGVVTYPSRITALGFPVMHHAAVAPVAPDLSAELRALEIDSLASGDTHEELALTGTALAAQNAGGVSFHEARWTNVDISGSRLEQLELRDCALDVCDLANLDGRRANLTRVSIENSRLTGIELNEAVIRDVTIRASRIDLASLSFSRLERVTFEDCRLEQADFLDAQLDSVRFHGCGLAGADFRGAQLHRCEFRRSSDLTGLQGVQSLRGAAMEWPDIVAMAGQWAAALGVEVLDAD